MYLCWSREERTRTMGRLLLVLGGDSVAMPLPTAPGLLLGRDTLVCWATSRCLNVLATLKGCCPPCRSLYRMKPRACSLSMNALCCLQTAQLKCISNLSRPRGTSRQTSASDVSGLGCLCHGKFTLNPISSRVLVREIILEDGNVLGLDLLFKNYFMVIIKFNT